MSINPSIFDNQISITDKITHNKGTQEINISKKHTNIILEENKVTKIRY